MLVNLKIVLEANFTAASVLNIDCTPTCEQKFHISSESNSNLKITTLSSNLSSQSFPDSVV